MRSGGSCDKYECGQYLSNNLISFSHDEREKLLQFMETIRFRKQSHIPNGLIRKNVCIVGMGSVRHYFYQDKSEEQTLRFTFTGELLHYYGESGEQLQAISDCIIYVISNDIFTEITGSSNKLKECIDHSTMNKLGFEVNLLRISAEERCKLIQKKEKDIFLNVPAKYIASYLGITPQALCRIRKRQL